MDESHSLFFYGTLVHPAILSRILASPGFHLIVQNAILPHYSTFKVKGADYPALLDPSRIKQLDPNSSNIQNRSRAVPGTLVKGLTKSDLEFLDAFEGKEYQRSNSKIILDPNSKSESNDKRSKIESLSTILSNLTPDYIESLMIDGNKSVEDCQVYVWIDSLEKLENESWTFESFSNENSHKWVGPGLTEEGEIQKIKFENDDHEGNNETNHAWEEYSIVDKLRQSDINNQIDLSSIENGNTTNRNEKINNTTSTITTASVPDPWKEESTKNVSSPPIIEPSNPWASATHTENIPTSSIRRKNSERKDSSSKVQEEEEEEMEFGLEKLGNPARRWWGFAEGYTNLNNGSFGACPKPVCESYKQMQDKVEEQPDLHILKTEPALYEQATEKLSPLLNVPSSEIALVTNSTTATNAILRDLKWLENDGILCLSTVYGAVERTFKYLNDINDNRIKIVTVEINYPISHDEVVKKVEETIEKVRKEGKIKLKLGIVDAITSAPGVIVPWERLVKVLRDNEILSFIDGAHAIGQIPLDLSISQPDFFVSNCHKWLYAKRGCAVFHVPKRNQHLNKSSLPTSHYYQENPTFELNSWKEQWKAFGTVEMGTLLSVTSALEFRSKLGGEKRIRNYNRNLAYKGGEIASKVLETEIMETLDNELTANMVNVRLPLINSKVNDENWIRIRIWMMETLTNEFKTVMPVFRHNEKMWARMSAQVWLEPSDFEYGARALKVLCQRINTGEVTI